MLGCNVGLHQVTDLHFVSPAFSRAWNISGHERLGFITARLESFKALGPVVNERTSIDFSWNGIKPFRHAMKHLPKAYELEPGIYQACVILYVEIRQQLCFHMALARNQERLGGFTDFLMERSWRKYFYSTLQGETWWLAPRCLWCSALERLFPPFLPSSYFSRYLKVERPLSSSRIAINRSGWATAPPSAPVLCGEISQDVC